MDEETTLCPYCEKVISLPDQWQGNTLKCPCCAGHFLVPGTAEKVSIFTGLKKFAVFSGRATLREFWLTFIFLLLLSFLDLTVTVAFSITSSPEYEHISAVFYFVILLALFIPLLSAAVRRLHDSGFSGWWLLVFLLPFGSLVLLFLLCKRGTPGSNRFGADPRQGGRESRLVLVLGVPCFLIMSIFLTPALVGAFLVLGLQEFLWV